MTGKQEPDSRLDLPGDDGAPLVVVGKPGDRSGHPLQQVVNEQVLDAHVVKANLQLATCEVRLSLKHENIKY